MWILGAAPGHIQHNGIVRTGVRFDAGASGLNTAVKSVWVRFRKFGNPRGNLTIGIRKASDDSLVTIGTRPVKQFRGSNRTIISCSVKIQCL